MPKSTSDRLDFKALRAKLAQVEQERDALRESALTPHMMAGLLTSLKEEAEAQHARAERAEQIVSLAQAWKRALVAYGDGTKDLVGCDNAYAAAQDALFAALPNDEDAA